MLSSLHNVRFYQRLVEGAREAILAGDYEGWRREFLAGYRAGAAAAAEDGD